MEKGKIDRGPGITARLWDSSLIQNSASESIQFGQRSEMKGSLIMKKLMIAASAALCATVGLSLESANVVGYQNKGMATANFNFECATFQAVGKARDAQTLGDIKASENFSYSEIQFLTSGGANAYVEHPQLGRVKQSYTYWADPDWTEAGVAGWYLYDDADGEYPDRKSVV